jgi:hypothetical protein
MVEICKILWAPALWLALLLLVASTATRGDAAPPQSDRCSGSMVFTAPTPRGF